MGALDSPVQERGKDWAGWYEDRFGIWGASFNLLPLGDPKFGQPADATHALLRFDTTGHTANFTPREVAAGSTLVAFDTPLNLKNPAHYQGDIITVDLNGTDESLDTPDANFYTVTATNLFSVSFVAKFDAVASQWLFTKWDETTGTEAREWRLGLASDGKLRMEIYDETANSFIGRSYNTALVAGRYYVFHATYDGTTASTGIVLYIDGSVVDDTTVEDGVLTSMQNTTTLPRIGSYLSTGGARTGFINGKVAGGPCGPATGLVTLTAFQVVRDYRLMRRWLGL